MTRQEANMPYSARREALDATVGLPRLRASWLPTDRRGDPTGEPPQSLPAPWVNGSAVADGRWLQFRADFDPRAVHAQRLCAVCGLGIPGPLVYLRNAPFRSGDTRPATNGPGTHPVCAVLAARHCPHLVQQTAADPDATIAYLWTEPGHAYDMPADGPEATREEQWEALFFDRLYLTGDIAPLTLQALTALARAQERPARADCPTRPAAPASCPHAR